METHYQFINRLKSKLRDLKISYQFLNTQLRGEGEILHYYRQEIDETEQKLYFLLSAEKTA